MVPEQIYLLNHFKCTKDKFVISSEDAREKRRNQLIYLVTRFELLLIVLFNKRTILDVWLLQ